MYWMTLIGFLAILSLLGIWYLSGRLCRFSFLKHCKRWLARLISLGAVVGLTAVLVLTLNVMNAIVCILHLMLIWALCDLGNFIVRKCRKKEPRRYIAGALALVLTVGWLGWGWFCAHHVYETSYALHTQKAVGGLRVVQITDSHMGATFHADRFRAYLEEIQACEPDVVLITGDFVDDDTSREDMLEACEALKLLHPTYGTYFCYGNHDAGYYSEALKGWTNTELYQGLIDSGVTVLRDEAVLIDDRFYVVGRRDYSNYSRLEMDELTADLDTDKYIIVMDHQPHDYEAQAASGVDLVLSGHTHGGQLIPINHVGQWLDINCRTYGHEKRGSTDFIVSSGISCWSLKFKTGCISEYVVIDID